MSAIDRITYANPDWHEWTGTAGATPSVDAGITTELDMGAVTAGDNSDAKGLALHFGSTFGDYVGQPEKIYLINNPALTGHTWQFEAGAAVTFPATALDNPLTAGADIPGNPFDATSVNIWNSTDKRLEYILVQLQTAGTATAFDTSKNIYQLPFLAFDFARLDKSESYLREAMWAINRCKGHLFVFSDVEIYYKKDGNWIDIGRNVKEDSVTVTTNYEFAEWAKGKPAGVYQKALNTVTCEIKFASSQPDPNLDALASQYSNASNNATDETQDYGISAKTRPVIDTAWAIRYTTHGGFKQTVVVDRGTLMQSGDWTPGGGEFASKEYTVTALVNCDTLNLATVKTSNTPIETALLPLNYSVA